MIYRSKWHEVDGGTMFYVCMGIVLIFSIIASLVGSLKEKEYEYEHEIELKRIELCEEGEK